MTKFPPHHKNPGPTDGKRLPAFPAGSSPPPLRGRIRSVLCPDIPAVHWESRVRWDSSRSGSASGRPIDGNCVNWPTRLSGRRLPRWSETPRFYPRPDLPKTPPGLSPGVLSHGWPSVPDGTGPPSVGNVPGDSLFSPCRRTGQKTALQNCRPEVCRYPHSGRFFAAGSPCPVRPVCSSCHSADRLGS